jgi:hypothetical protein
MDVCGAILYVQVFLVKYTILHSTKKIHTYSVKCHVCTTADDTVDTIDRHSWLYSTLIMGCLVYFKL